MAVEVVVSKIGTGTEADPYRPDVPDGIAWKWVSETEDTITVIVADEDADMVEGV